MNEIQDMKACIGQIAAERVDVKRRVKNIATLIKQGRQNDRVESTRSFEQNLSGNHAANA